MKTVGIICEYNPLHIGHRKQLAWIHKNFGEDAAIVCLMSGNYVQRGEPAVFDKFVRAQAAICCGANLVLELPLTKAIHSAEGFAMGGVDIFNRLGEVKYLCFGSETGQIAPLWQTATLLQSETFSHKLQELLPSGLSFPAARQKALEAMGEKGDTLTRPNDILAVEYCKALLRTNSTIEPLTISRPGDYHAETPNRENPSATAVRKAILQCQGDWKACTPEAVWELYSKAARYDFASGERAFLARLRSMSDAEFAALPFSSEGLWNKVKTACRTQSTLEEILQAAKSKRYPYSRLKRMLLCAYLGITQEHMDKEVPYVRILGFDGTGRKLLRKFRNTGEIPLINAGADCPDKDYQSLEIRAANLFTLFAQEKENIKCGMEQAGRVYCREK